MKYIDPDGRHVDVKCVEFLRDVVLDPCAEFWQRGTGSISLVSPCSQGSVRLLVLPSSPTNRVFLKWIDGRKLPLHEMLSLADIGDLEVKIECEEEWFASRGLFLLPEAAWGGVEYFAASDGGRASGINWVLPDDLPEHANW